MKHPTESTPPDGTDGVNEVAEAFEVGQAIERHRTSEAIKALQRLQKRFDDAEKNRHLAYAQGYVDSADGLAPDLLYGPRQTDRHDARRFGHGDGGHDVWCSCGWKSQLHRTGLQAVVEWREHAGEPPIRPDLHPMWCDDIHEQRDCEVHFGSIGLLRIADDVRVTALLDNSGPDGGLVVNVTVVGSVGDVTHQIPIDPAPKPGRRTRKKHALTPERTKGDHYVWRCVCGWKVAHDPGDDITPDLIAHAMGEKR